jgi:hypothetical protein
MFIDTSRIRTMQRIQRELDDPKVPLHTKKKAFRLKSKIQHELKDPILANMRERLTRAVSAGDKYETWKLTCQIKDYMKEEIPTDIYER